MRNMVASVGIAFLLASSAQARNIYVPPDSFLHPFPGHVIVTGNDIADDQMSAAHRWGDHCWIELSSAKQVSPALRQCLLLIELANCNGAIDVNGDPRGALQVQGYERTCSSQDWTPVYNRLFTTVDDETR